MFLQLNQLQCGCALTGRLVEHLEAIRTILFAHYLCKIQVLVFFLFQQEMLLTSYSIFTLASLASRVARKALSPCASPSVDRFCFAYKRLQPAPI